MPPPKGGFLMGGLLGGKNRIMQSCEFRITSIGIHQKFSVENAGRPGTGDIYVVTKLGEKAVLRRQDGKVIKIDLERLLRDGEDRKGRLRFEPMSEPPESKLTNLPDKSIM